MRKFVEWLETWIPYLWTILMVIIVTSGGIGLSVVLVSWVIDLLGVL